MRGQLEWESSSFEVISNSHASMTWFGRRCGMDCEMNSRAVADLFLPNCNCGATFDEILSIHNLCLVKLSFFWRSNPQTP